MGAKTQTEIHRFFCTQCGEEGIPIARRKSKKRGIKHLKKLYCVHCSEFTNHCEIEPDGFYQVSDFIEDFNRGKFKGA